MPILVYRNGDIVSCPTRCTSGNNTGKTGTKTYRMDYGVYRTLAGAVVEMWKKRKNNITFLTLTSRDPIPHKIYNRLLSKYLENMRANYGLNAYIWTAERQKRGAIHYHILMDSNYYDIRQLRNYYNNLIAPYSRPSNNCLRLPPSGGYVRTINDVVRYMCKYMSKAINEQYDARCYSCSKHLVTQPVKLNSLHTIKKYLSAAVKKVNKYEHVTVYNCHHSIYDYASYMHEAIQPLPEKIQSEIIQLTLYDTTDKQQSNNSQTTVQQQSNNGPTSEKNKIKNLKLQEIREILKKQPVINKKSIIYTFENDKSFDCQAVRAMRIEHERAHYSDYIENS